MGVDQEVLGLDVPVAHPDAVVDVGQGAADLVGVELHVQQRHALVHLVVVLGDAVHCLGHELQHQVQVQLLLLRGREEAVLERHDGWVVQQTHDLKLAVLVPLVLQHLLDGNRLIRLQAGGLENNSERTVPDHTFGGVADGLQRKGARHG